MGTLVTDNIFGLGNTNPIDGSVFFELGDRIQVPSSTYSTNFNLGGDFTIEGWVKPSIFTSYPSILHLDDSTNSKDLYINFRNGATLGITNDSTVFATSPSFTLNEWSHFAVVRNSNSVTVYCNGVGGSSASCTTDFGAGNQNLYIGMISSLAASDRYRGYISNLRIVKGSALYTANFTPPTEELTVVENTVLLCCQDSNNPLQEATGKTIIPYGRLMVPVDNPELVTNGDFSNDLIGWDDVSVGTGYVRYDTSRKAAQVHRVDGSNSGRIAQGMGLEAGKVYDVRVRCHSDSNTGLQFRGYKSSDSSLSSTVYTRVLGTYGTTVFHFRYSGESGYDGLWFLPIDNTSTNSYITNISVKEYDPRPGDNLVLNGNGDSGKTNEWTDANTSTFEINAGRIKVTRSGGTGLCSYQALTTVVGQEYTIRADIEKGAGSYGDIRVYTDSGFGTWLVYIRGLANTAGLRETTFTATTTTTHLVFVIDSDGETAYYDNIVVTPVHNYNSVKSVPTFGALADDGVVFVGDTKFDTKRYMVPPTADTSQRGRGRGLFFGGYAPSPNSLRNIIDYVQIQSQGNALDFGDLLNINNGEGGNCASSTRALAGGGLSNIQTITYVTIATTGNATSFGDLITGRRSLTAVSNSTRGLFAGGTTPTMKNEIEYVFISTLGDAIDFGDLMEARRNIASSSSPTRGVFAGGNPGSSPLFSNRIDYVEFATTGSQDDFGDLMTAMREQGGSSNSIRGLIAGGWVSPANVNTIEYITIATKGDAQDYGDLDTAVSGLSGTSNGTRGIFAGGSYINNIQYVTISTFGNAKDFGDLTAPRMLYDGTSDSHGGLS